MFFHQLSSRNVLLVVLAHAHPLGIPGPQNPNPWGITSAPPAERLECLGWVQPRHGHCTPGVNLHLGSPSTAELRVPPGHAPVNSRG